MLILDAVLQLFDGEGGWIQGGSFENGEGEGEGEEGEEVAHRGYASWSGGGGKVRGGQALIAAKR